MNFIIIRALIRKDIKSVLSNKKMFISMVIFSLLLCVFLPWSATESILKDGTLLQHMIVHLSSEVVKTPVYKNNSNENSIFYFLNYPLISLFMMSTVLNSTIIASTSFVGEKERGTLETLLFSPIRIRDLFLGKIAAAFFFSFTFTYSCFILLVFLEGIVLFPVYHTFSFLLNLRWLMILLWLAPALILFIILINIFISARAKTFQESQQLGSMITMPIFGLIITQISGVFLVSSLSLGIVGGILLLMDLSLAFFMIRKNQRNRLFESQLSH